MVDEKALTVDTLAQEIRRVDGNHSLGAGALIEQQAAELAAERQRSDTLRVQRDGHAAELAEARRAISAVTAATSAYLPPNGISKDECINRVLAATDNPKINAVMLGGPNGSP